MAVRQAEENVAADSKKEVDALKARLEVHNNLASSSDLSDSEGLIADDLPSVPDCVKHPLMWASDGTCALTVQRSSARMERRGRPFVS